MKILTAEEMRVADLRTSEQFGVDSLTLMENAGDAVARFVLCHYSECKTIVVVCGGGNNGGDGFVAARRLKHAGCYVSVVLLSEPDRVAGDARVMLDRMGMEPVVMRDAADIEGRRDSFVHADLIVDAVLGTGFKPPMREPTASFGRILAASSAKIIAIDLPSGWDADSRLAEGPGAYRADAVVTFTAPKLAHVFGNLTRGPIVAAQIGSPDEAIASSTQLTWAGGSKRIAERARPVNSNKGKFGHVLVIGGARGTAGAPSMASLAALRAGAGLVTVAVPASILPTVASFAAELMTVPLAEGAEGEISSRNLEAGNLDALLKRKTVIAVGPGLGQHVEVEAFVLGLLRETSVPMVIDADALNALARGHVDLLDGRDRTIILTPHPGEMARLVSLSIAEVEQRREELAREFAMRHQVTLVLKGWRTLIAHPDGAMAINTSGNSAMAKGGSGDILTGIVAAMVAQYPESIADAVNAAVYLHGLAADFAVIEQDEHTLLASDTIAHLFRAFRFRPEDRDGYLWLQGMHSGNVER